ncbi:MAG: hypothetical protein LUQ71_02520 [Methanoregula sp.]|nr:hypothetical protein [Methanoregula sp.]
MKSAGLLSVLVILLLLLPVSAAEVSLSTPQRDYYVLTGGEAVIPLTIVSTYDHDITGTLKTVMVPAGSRSRDTSVQDRSFSAFTETRTVSLPVGRSDTPADFLLTVLFSYPEEDGRTSTLGGITIHFVTSTDNVPAEQDPVTSTDTTDPATGTSPEGSTSREKPQENSPAEKLQNSQQAQDMPALKNQMAKESNQSGDTKDELLRSIRADPLVMSLDRSLSGAGFSLNNTDIIPVTNRSGNFILTYSSGPKNAVITGVIRETRVLFAEESSDVTIPLPDLLPENATYNEYGSRVAEKGFLKSRTRINVTPGAETVNLTYANAKNRIIRMNAQLENGTVVAIIGESPEDPFASVVPVIAAISVILIIAGIWYLARTHRNDIPASVIPVLEMGPGKTFREITLGLLDEAELDAARGSWPEAYRKTGRALRIFLSHEISSGDELTSGELEPLIGSFTGDAGQVRFVLDRCRTVGFAKDTPEPGELFDMIRSVRALLRRRD